MFSNICGTYRVLGSTFSDSVAEPDINAIDGSLYGASTSKYEHIAACKFLQVKI